MSCGANRCALRRFDGHGSSSYRPTNPEVAREFQSRMDQMMAARGQQDQGVFVAPTPASSFMQPQQPQQQSQQQQVRQLQTHPVTFYPLSDSAPRK